MDRGDFKEMSLQQKYDLLDLLISSLQEHEKRLDTLNKRFEKLVNKLEMNAQ